MAKCKNCNNLYNLSDENDVIVGKWCPKINDSPDLEMERDCEHFKCLTNADRIRQMTDEELAKFIDAVKCCFLYGDECGYPYCHSMKGDYCNGIAEKTNMNHLAWLQSEAE